MTWTAVEDGLPPNSKWVRAKNAEGVVFEKIGYSELGNYWREFNFGRGLDKIHRNITHWEPVYLPLPELEK